MPDMDTLADHTLDFPHAAPPEGGTMFAVAPGIWWLRMPLPFRLDHINLWLAKDGEHLAAIDTGIARAALEDALHFVRTRSRPWVDAGIDKASDDPLTLKSFGHLAIRLHAAEALLERAGEFLDRARDDSSADNVAAASIAVADDPRQVQRRRQPRFVVRVEWRRQDGIGL